MEGTHATRTLSSTSRNDGANSAAIGINGQISIPAARFGAAGIVLLAAEGWPNKAIGEAVGLSQVTVGKWRRRFVEHGLNGLYDELRPGERPDRSRTSR